MDQECISNLSSKRLSTYGRRNWYGMLTAATCININNYINMKQPYVYVPHQFMYIQLINYRIGLPQSLNFAECNLFPGVAVSVGAAVWVSAATHVLPIHLFTRISAQLQRPPPKSAQ